MTGRPGTRTLHVCDVVDEGDQLRLVLYRSKINQARQGEEYVVRRGSRADTDPVRAWSAATAMPHTAASRSTSWTTSGRCGSGPTATSHPQRPGWDELWTKTETHAFAVTAADPTAATLGTSDLGWCAYFFAPVDDPNYACATGPDRQAHGDRPLAEWYLTQARANQEQQGVRILDYLDEHYHPQANQVAAGAWNKTRSFQAESHLKSPLFGG